jgi:hypothetical protein
MAMVHVPFGIIVYMPFIPIFKVQGYSENCVLVKERRGEQLKPVYVTSPDMG